MDAPPPLACARSGAGDRLLVLIHGLTGSASSVAKYRPDLPGMTTVSVELPGHGASPASGAFTLDDVAARVAETIAPDAAQAARTHVLGVSLGATVARALATRPGLDVDSLILIRPTHTAEPNPPHLALNLVLADLLESDHGSAVERLREHPAFARVAEDSPAAAANLLTKARAADDVVARRRARLLRAGTAWTTPAGPTGTPALVVAAPRDALHPAAIAEAWAADLPLARLVVAPTPTDPTHDAEVRRQITEQLEAPHD